ncbi:TRAP transporter permease [Candidatus Thioglobus sp.]|nr:TRAP transporter permease [Candidatus Thioglobus sp.]
MEVDLETGNRNPGNLLIRNILIYVAMAWSVFQLYVSSPLVLEVTPWMNADVVKRVHVSFAGFLAFLSYPALKRSSRVVIPWADWIMGILIVVSCLYLVYNQVWDSRAFEMRLGVPNSTDLFLSIIGILLLLEATRRSLGPPLMVVAIIALTYAFLGAGGYGGASLNKIVSHMWITTEGAFGIAVGVSASMVFLFVLFGALLERAGAGNYFIRVAYALTGHYRGGPAKAAVVSSAMTGMISGSSIANVVTTGTFTIPLMKRVGFPSEKAGAIEVASSTNGQLTPPIMGTAAFLMVEYVGVSYIEVIKHAFLPAVISYIALIYIVHLEALKSGMEGLTRTNKLNKVDRLIGISSVLIVLGALVWVLPPLFEFIKMIAGEATTLIVALIMFFSYVGLLYSVSRMPDLPSGDIIEIPEIGKTVKAGLHFLLPVILLIWLLTVERFSPETSVYWATMFMMFIVLTQKFILALFRRQSNFAVHLVSSLIDLKLGFVNGARNMIGVGVATTAAGIIVGTVTLTGVGQLIIGWVEFIAAGNLFLILLFTAMISLILGMGLPTTANYIVVSSLMAPVIMSLGAANNVAIPLIAAHMFVFYFGILADDTPPVGLAAYAAAAISKGDPIRTGIQGFIYDMRTAVLPFIFIFNTQLLMIGIDSVISFISVVTSSVIAILLFAAATQGYWLVKNRLWETVLMLFVAFMFFRPGYFWDKVDPPYENISGQELFTVAESMSEGESIRFVVEGETIEGVERSYTFLLPLADGATGRERVNNTGLQIDDLFGDMEVAMVLPGISNSRAINKQVESIKVAGVDSGWIITSVLQERETMPKQIVYIPAILLIGMVGFVQLRRKRKVVQIQQ